MYMCITIIIRLHEYYRKPGGKNYITPAVSGADTGWRPSKKATSWILVENWRRDLAQYPNII